MRADSGIRFGRLVRMACAATALAASAVAHAALVQIINIDGPGVGFNDPTPATPVGGNMGTTIGEQRQIVFAFVAEFWGRRLRSDVPIQVLATFDELDCDETTGVLGAAGAWNIFRDFPNAKRAGTWYPSALANKLAGIALVDNPDPFESADVIAFFNGKLGQPGCLSGSGFYMGLDNKPGATQINLVTTVLHEFGHGLGFQTFTRGTTGLQFGATAAAPDSGFPSIWDYQLRDPALGKTWERMSNEQRVVSAATPRNLVWDGANVRRSAPKVLERGTPDLFLTGPGLDRFVLIGEAEFGPPIDRRTLVVEAMAAVVDQADGRGLACTALDAANAKAVRGKVAVVDRGTCTFTTKVKNAQLAGAKAVLVVDNVAGSPPPDLAGTDATIIIPSVRVSRDDGAAIKSALATQSQRRDRSYAVLFLNQAKLRGADYAGRVYLYTPNPFRSGSSVSHYDTLARRNLLMEPFANDDEAIAVSAPKDLTLELLLDIGW